MYFAGCVDRADGSAGLRRFSTPILWVVSRLVSVLCAAFLLTACGSEGAAPTDESQGDTKTPALACRAGDVKELVDALQSAAVVRRGELVGAGLRKA